MTKKKLYIKGKWLVSENYYELYSPYSKELIAEIPIATSEMVKKAVDAASESFKVMNKLTAYERSQILEELVELFKLNRDKAAHLISLESAKPLKHSLLEIDRTIETYKFSAEEAKRIAGEVISMDAAKNGKNTLGYTLRKPLGVISAITPFNFPQNLVAHKVGPALASGNTIVLKPASQTPLSAILLAELLDQTSLPKGAFNLVLGSGSEIGDIIVKHKDVKMVTFTGSPQVGKKINEKAGLKKVVLELGSNAGLIIDKDVDLDHVVQRCVTGAFSNQGQICISLQRIYIDKTILNEFLTKLRLETEKLILGNPLEYTTDISAMISSKEQDRALKWVKQAVEEGAELIYGGVIEDNTFLPTILKNVSPESKVSCEEVFAPIVIVNSIDSFIEGINEINRSEFGLQAGLFTNNIKSALIASEELEVGGVIINDIPTFRVDQMPYGGVKESGIGKEGIKYTIEEMTEAKLIVWKKDF